MKKKQPIVYVQTSWQKNFGFKDIFDAILYGSRPVASLNKDEMKDLAAKVWEENPKNLFIDFIVLQEIKDLPVGDKTVFYSVSEGYIHNK